MGFRQRLLELIDRSGVSDRRLSMLATGKALCRVLGFRLEGLICAWASGNDCLN